MVARVDALDKKILGELQRDAAQSLDEIAKRVGSSKTPVWNRIRKMREAGVIRMRFGLGDGQPKTLDQIGDTFGVTRERIRQIEVRAFEKIQEHMRALAGKKGLLETA